MKLCLYNFNNYANRILDRRISLEDYQDYFIKSTSNGVNFNPNDGVNTSIVLNIADDEIPNYIICIPDGTLDIHSRWYVIDANRTTGNQYRLTLMRDVLADYYEEVYNSTAFIQKGMLPMSSPFIYNSEGMSFNQIKKAEFPLYDSSECPWIVAYLSTNKPTNEVKWLPNNVVADIVVDSLGGWDYTAENEYNVYQDGSGAYHAWAYNSNVHTIYEFSWNNKDPQQCILNNNDYGVSSKYQLSGHNTSLSVNVGMGSIGLTLIDGVNNLIANTTSSTDNKIKSWYSTNITGNGLLENVGKTIKDTATGKVYKIGVSYGDIETVSDDIATGSSPYNEIQGIVDNVSEISGTGNNASYTITYKVQKIRPTFVELAQEDAISIPFSDSGLALKDAPYYMVAMPVEGTVRIAPGDTGIFKIESDVTYGLAQQMGRALGSELYDIQLLPYCPVPNIVYRQDLQPIIDVRTLNQNTDYVFITDEKGTKKSVMFYCIESSFDSTIYLTDEQQARIDNIVNKSYDYKIQNECDKWRLCAPGYTNTYEFSMAKNGGFKGFNIQCTYKPFNPLIAINPVYGGLYGQTFNKEQRGLILSGDFSMPIVTDAWVQYQLNNKNYDIFNRQMVNMDVQQGIQRQEAIWGMIAGTAQGGVSGGVTGSIIGGPAGALGAGIGAALGAGASLAAGIADYNNMQKLQKEQKSYATDMYNYNLGNIKATPNTLTKTSAFTILNKLVPFLEYYTCTDDEKEAFINKLSYNGMSIGVIGTVRNYIDNIYNNHKYIQGSIINIDIGYEDAHMRNAINDELMRGVRIRV